MKRLFLTGPRYLISLTVLLTMLFLAPVGYGLADDTMVVIDPQNSGVAVGATTTVSVRIENVEGLYGAEVHLTFNPALLEVVDADQGMSGIQVQPGPFLSPDFTGQNVVDQAAGKIDFAIAQMPPHEAVNGSGVFVTITFKGKAAGDSAISITNALLSDQSGNPISTGTRDGNVTVTSEATPTPTLTPTTENTPTPTPTTENTPTPTPTTQNTPTPTATPQNTLTVTPTPTTSSHTPTPTPTRTPTPSPGTILGYHTVRSGETLYCIGRAYGVDPYAIASRNSILNPSLIYAGKVLAIPNVPRVLPAGRTCPRQFDGDEPPSECRWYHTVIWGENLYRISLHYGVSMWAIAEANGIFNLNYIRAGQVLCIP